MSFHITHGLVPLDELVPVGVRVGEVLRGLGDRRDQRAEVGHRRAAEGPVEAAAVVGAEPHAPAADGGGELADDVPFGLPVRLERVAVRARPQRDAVVVLGDEHDVLRTGGREQVGPGVGVPPGMPARNCSTNAS